MGKVDSFEELFVWQEARELVKHIYKVFGKSKDYGFKDQIQRASVSIMNNIAEGFERSSDKEFIRFLFIAKASSGEVRSMLYLAIDLNYIEPNMSKTLLEKCKKISGSISNLIKYLEKQKH